MRKSFVLGVSIIFVVVSSGLCRGDDLIPKWRAEHHHEVVKLIRGYFRGKPASVQRITIREIVRLEALLSTCSKKEKAFYLAGITTDDLARIPGEILIVYLRHKGIHMDARHFFQGKHVTYFVKGFWEDNHESCN